MHHVDSATASEVEPLGEEAQSAPTRWRKGHLAAVLACLVLAAVAVSSLSVGGAGTAGKYTYLKYSITKKLGTVRLQAMEKLDVEEIHMGIKEQLCPNAPEGGPCNCPPPKWDKFEQETLAMLAGMCPGLNLEDKMKGDLDGLYDKETKKVDLDLIKVAIHHVIYHVTEQAFNMVDADGNEVADEEELAGLRAMLEGGGMPPEVWDELVEAFDVNRPDSVSKPTKEDEDDDTPWDWVEEECGGKGDGQLQRCEVLPGMNFLTEKFNELHGPCTSNDDCPHGFCYGHGEHAFCAPCEECHWCHDGFDFTCGECGAPTMESEDCQAQVICSAHEQCDAGSFCAMWNMCSPCADCWWCYDGMDETCGECGAPTMEPEQDCKNYDYGDFDHSDFDGLTIEGGHATTTVLAQ